MLTFYLNVLTLLLSPRTRRKNGVSFERWSARLPVQRWDPPSVVQAGVWLMHMPPGCLGTYSSRRGGASNRTQMSLLTRSAFYIFLSGRSTPEISSTFAIKGTFKPQWPWPSACEYTGDTWTSLNMFIHLSAQCWWRIPVTSFSRLLAHWSIIS